VLNGRQIVGERDQAGDLLLSAKVGCRVVATEKTPAAPLSADAQACIVRDDDGPRACACIAKIHPARSFRTDFRQDLSMVGTLVVGRSNDSGICIPTDEISRPARQAAVVPDGVMVEDMGSANGTFVKQPAVHAGTLLKPAIELRLDTVRISC